MDGAFSVLASTGPSLLPTPLKEQISILGLAHPSPLTSVNRQLSPELSGLCRMIEKYHAIRFKCDTDAASKAVHP